MEDRFKVIFVRVLTVPLFVFCCYTPLFSQCTIPANVTLVAVTDHCELWANVQKSYFEASVRMDTFDYITDNNRFKVALYEDGLLLKIVQHPTMFNGFTGKFDINVVNGIQVSTVQYALEYDSAYHLLDHEMTHWLWWKRYVWHYPKGEYTGVHISDLYTRDWYQFIGHGNMYDPFVNMLNLAIGWFSNIPTPSNYDPGRLPSR